MNYLLLGAHMFFSIDSIDTVSRHIDQTHFIDLSFWRPPCLPIRFPLMRQILSELAVVFARTMLAMQALD
ncbi:MAG: hypothetical protein K0M58_00900 [Thiobacillus sp.]|nr:hypothetical protein [Thiobacillus sp.]